MSKGIVKATPIVTKPGSISVTIADVNPYKIAKGALLDFINPAVKVNVNDTVEVNITSATTCSIVKVLTAINPGS
jgi:hypothetical protein